MGARVRPDGPDARIKFTRDWEYPWVFLRAEATAGARILDCGAGYSPLPFLWARHGATVIAIDRDALVASKPAYAVWCIREMFADLASDARRSAGRMRADEPRAVAATRARPQRATTNGRDRPPTGRVKRFLKYHVRQNRYRWSRLLEPDVWGPVSPSLLKKYGVAYESGDLTRLPFPPAAFDVVTCVSVLEHMPASERAVGLREMARVLRPGGRLIVTYDLADEDISESLVTASGCRPAESVYFHASKLLYASNAPDVVGLRLDKP